MIAERELRRIAAGSGIGVGQAEHEYVLLCTLDALSKSQNVSETFCLKGGTALRLIYFSDWRHSVDLDFSILPGFRGEGLRMLVEEWFASVSRLHGVELRLTDFHGVNGAARMRAQFLGPLRHPGKLLFDITMDEPVLLPPERRPALASPFPGLRPLVLTYSLEEILVEKMRSVVQRGKARDYYDVWRLLGEKRSALKTHRACSIIEEKFAHKGLRYPSVESFFDAESLEAARSFWERDLGDQVVEKSLPGWDEAIGELKEHLHRFLMTCRSAA